MNIKDGVAKTSLLTAAMRAAETELPNGFFKDPFAAKLAGPEGMELKRKGIEVAGDQPAIAVRTHYMDQKISNALKDGIRQIVMIAAGMDTRAYRMSFPAGTTVYELDRKEVIDYKSEILGNATPACELKRIPTDLEHDWQEKLIGAGFKKGERALWLIEGLFMYLDEAEAMTLLTRVNNISTSRDIMLFDILSRTLLDAPFMKAQLEFLQSLGAPWKFGMNEPEEFMEKIGWVAIGTMPGEFAPDRWPFPAAPRSVPNVPRSFFVEARKV